MVKKHFSQIVLDFQKILFQKEIDVIKMENPNLTQCNISNIIRDDH